MSRVGMEVDRLTSIWCKSLVYVCLRVRFLLHKFLIELDCISGKKKPICSCFLFCFVFLLANVNGTAWLNIIDMKI